LDYRFVPISDTAQQSGKVLGINYDTVTRLSYMVDEHGLLLPLAKEGLRGDGLQRSTRLLICLSRLASKIQVIRTTKNLAT
jgi:hypothetical protein